MFNYNTKENKTKRNIYQKKIALLRQIKFAEVSIQKFNEVIIAWKQIKIKLDRHQKKITPSEVCRKT